MQRRSERRTDARKIRELTAQRRHFESARWNRICCQVWRDITDVTDPDAELMAAIDPFRQRQLAKIDAQLAEIGIEPPARQTEEQKPNCLIMILDNEG